MFSSFNPLALLRIRRQLPEVPVGLLALPQRKGVWARSWLGRLIPHQALHPHSGDTTSALVRRVHRSHRRIYVWTVNQSSEMQRLFSLGVDAIFTDDPLLARETLKDARASSVASRL
jgi:glycerophosphoryl diester phosphodiesterase